MKHWKKSITIVMIALLLVSAFAFSGCVKDKSRVEIVLMSWHGEYDSTQYYKGYKYLAEEYMKSHTDVKVTLRSEPDSSYSQILETGFSGGTAPDIMLMKSSQRSMHLQNLLDLKDYFLKPSAYEPNAKKWIDTFIGGISSFKLENCGTPEEAKLGYMFLPFDGNPNFSGETMFVYNKKQISAAGLDPENPPKTYKEFFIWMDALSATFPDGKIAGNDDVGTKISQIAFEFGNHYFDSYFDGKYAASDVSDALFWDKAYIALTYSQNGFETDLDAAGLKVPQKGGPMALDSTPYNDAMISFTKKYLEQYRTGWVSTKDQDATLLFANGNVPLYTTTSNTYDALLTDVTSIGGDKFNSNDAIGLFPIPYVDSDTLDYGVTQSLITKEQADSARPWIAGKYSSVTGGQFDYGFAVNKKVGENQEKLDTVIDFLQFMTSKDIQSQYVLKAHSLSPIEGIAIPEDIAKFSSPMPEGGYATQMVGSYPLEWGLGPDKNWGTTAYNYLCGDNTHGYKTPTEFISAITEPLWYGDILQISAYKDAMNAKQAEYDGLPDGTLNEIKEIKAMELKIATYRYELYKNYYYEKTGALTSRV